jgi:hypothetical protein
MSKQLLIDAMPMRLTLEEGESGKVVARGEFARCDQPTQNGRTYPRSVYEREVKRMQESIGSRRAFGELDHPADGKTKLTRASHLITSLEIDDNGVVIGEAEILNTPNGKTLKAILDAGAEVGVSSRGFGSTKQGSNGSQMVGEDFVLRSFDFVADPAMKTAYPQIFAEDVEFEFEAHEFLDEFPELAEGIREREREAARAEAEQAVGAMVAATEEQVRAQMRESFEKTLAESISEVRESVSRSLREEFEADPDVAGARAVLGKIASLVEAFSGEGDERALRDAIKERDLKIASLKESNERISDLARKAAWSLVIEGRISGHPMADRIRKMVGSASDYASREELEERLDEVVAEYDEIAEERASIEEANGEATIRSLMARLEAMEAEVESSNERADEAATVAESLKEKLSDAVELVESYREQLDEAKSIAERAESTAYKARKTSGMTNSPRLMQMLEGVEDRDTIDKIVEEHGSDEMSSRDLRDLRARLKRGTKNEEEPLVESFGRGAKGVFRDPILGGMSANQLLELSGVKPRG